MSRLAASGTPALLGLLLVSVALTGCSDIENKPSTRPVQEPVSTEEPETPVGAAAADYADLSSYYPVAEGNSWTYELLLPKPLGTVVETETMTSVVPDGDDVRVTIERSFDFPEGIGTDTTDSVDYVFHADGSLEVPYQSMPNGDGSTVTVKDGSLLWPTDAEFEAGTKKTGTIEATFESGGVSYDQVLDFTLQGKGEDSVKVPFGRFDARTLSQKFTVSVPELGIDGLRVDSTIWLVDGVGMVKTETPGLLSDEPLVTRLVSFTPGD